MNHFASIRRVAMVSIGYDTALDHFYRFVYDKSATANEILPIVLMFACFWYVSFYVLKKVIRKLVHNKLWLTEAIERDYERSTKKMLVDLKIDMTKDEAIQWTLNDWPRMQCIYVQHLVGSLFCIPSLLGMKDLQVASSLACLGVLSEIGWEVQDMAEIFFVRAFYENGKQTWPDSIVFIFMLHHSLAMVMGVPMIIYYRTNQALHWLCFDLQFAAFIGLSLGEYTKVLDIKEPSQLRRFKIANFFALVTMAWTRVIHWTYLCSKLFFTWYNDRAWKFLFIGVISSIGFTTFSFLVCVKPYYKKFIKFLHVSAEYQKIPSCTSSEVRRLSAINLEQAAAELLEDSETLKIRHAIDSVFATRRVSRRHSSSISEFKVEPKPEVGQKRHSIQNM